MRYLPIGLLCVATAACAPAPVPDTIREVQEYQGSFVCEDGHTAKVRFEPFKATLEDEGATIELTQQPAARGFLYTGRGHTVRAGGNVDMTWTNAGGVTRHCKDSRVK